MPAHAGGPISLFWYVCQLVVPLLLNLSSILTFLEDVTDHSLGVISKSLSTPCSFMFGSLIKPGSIFWERRGKGGMGLEAETSLNKGEGDKGGRRPARS